jgi:hypothetical protein
LSEICLHFNLARNDIYKVAKFKDPSTKSRYVDAEFRDTKCKHAYENYQKAAYEDREKYALELDHIRFAFYERWKKKNSIVEIVKTNGPGDDVA